MLVLAVEAVAQLARRALLDQFAENVALQVAQGHSIFVRFHVLEGGRSLVWPTTAIQATAMATLRLAAAAVALSLSGFLPIAASASSNMTSSLELPQLSVWQESLAPRGKRTRAYHSCVESSTYFNMLVRPRVSAVSML